MSASWSRRQILGITSAAGAAIVWSETARSQTKSATSLELPVALLIGNTSYKPSSRSILSAHKNVRNLEDVLTDMGYGVTSIFDASKSVILSSLDAAIAKAPSHAPLFIYFCGHGINSYSKGEYRNYWLSSHLQVTPPVTAVADPVIKQQHFEQLASASPSLEEDIFPRLASTRAHSQTFVMVDACREIAGAAGGLDATLVQSRPPAGCLVGYATSPGKFALTPDDPNRNSYFAESLIEQLKAVVARTGDDGDMTQILQRVRIQVRERVNAIAKAENALDYLLGLTGQKTGYIQEPTYASSISAKPLLRMGTSLHALALATQPAATPAPLPSAPMPSAAASLASAAVVPAPLVPAPLVPASLSATAIAPPSGADSQAWADIETLIDPDAATAALQSFIQRYPASTFKDNAQARLEDVVRVRDAIRKTRLFRAPLRLASDSTLQNDYRAALQGDKFAAQRIAEAIVKNPSLGDAPLSQRWLQFAGELGNGIAAYAAFQKFNSQNLIQEASYYLALAQTSGYRIPRDFDSRK